MKWWAQKDLNLRPADYEEQAQGRTRAVTLRKPRVFPGGVGSGGRNRTYAELRVGRLVRSVAVSGRILSGFPDRTSEPVPKPPVRRGANQGVLRIGPMLILVIATTRD